MRRIIAMFGIAILATALVWMLSMRDLSMRDLSMRDSDAPRNTDRTDPPQVQVDEAPREPEQHGTRSEEPREAPAAELVVRVETEDGVAAAGAEIHVMFGDAWSRLAADAKDGIFAAVSRHGTRVTADQSGEVRLPSSPFGVCVAGEHRGEVGLLLLVAHDREPPGGIHALRLAGARNLEVTVTDTRGRPVAGIPLYVAAEGVGSRTAGTTDAHGAVLVQHADLSLLGPGTDYPVRRGHVGLWLPGLRGTRTAYDLTRAGTGRVRLVVPPHGALRIRCGPHTGTVRLDRGFAAKIDERFEARYPRVGLGQKYTVRVGGLERGFDGPTRPGEETVVDLAAQHTGSVSVTVRGPDGMQLDAASFQLSLSDQVAGYRSREFKADGDKAVFDGVPVASNLKLTARKGRIEAETRLAGPARDGEVVSAIVQLAADRMLRLRVLDEAGKPMPRATIGFKIRVDRGTAEGSNWSTDKHGVFLYKLHGKRLEWVVISTGRGGARLTASRVVGRDITGTIDLGDVKLGKAPLVLAGTLLRDDKPYRSLRPPYLFVEQRTGKPEGSWRRVETVDCAFGKNGRFTVRGTTGKGPLRLGINEGRDSICLPIEPVEFRAGQTDLVVHAETAARFQALVKLDHAMPAAAIHLEMLPIDRASGPDRPDWHLGRPMRKLRTARPAFEWRYLRAGRYRLVARCFGIEQPLAGIDGIELRAGRLNTDRRTRPLDLRGKLHAIRLRILDHSGKPPGRAAFLFVAGTGKASTEGYRIARDGAVTVLTPVLPIRVLPSIGTRLEWISGIDSDRTIRVRDRLRIVLALKGGGRTVPRGRVLRATLTCAAPVGLRLGTAAVSARGSIPLRSVVRTFDTAQLDSSGKATVRLPCCGDYNVGFDLCDDRDWWKGKVDHVDADTTVRITPGTRLIEVPCSQVAIDAAR